MALDLVVKTKDLTKKQGFDKDEAGLRDGSGPYQPIITPTLQKPPAVYGVLNVH